MKLAIIILHWRNKSQTEASLMKVLSWKKTECKILLIQNESKEDIFPHISEERVHKIFSEKNLGFGGGNNLGLDYCIKNKFDHCLLLNTDAEIDEENLSKIIESLASNNKIFSVGPCLFEGSKGQFKTYIGGKDIALNVNTRIEKNESPNTKGVIEVDYTIGAIILLSVPLLKKVGLFDTNYFFSGEVADLCHRAKKLGFHSATNLDAIGFHHIENQNLRNQFYRYYSLRNRFVFMRKHQYQSKHIDKWYKFILKEWLYAAIKLDFKSFKMFTIVLIHAFNRTNGNQHKLFKT